MQFASYLSENSLKFYTIFQCLYITIVFINILTLPFSISIGIFMYFLYFYLIFLFTAMVCYFSFLCNYLYNFLEISECKLFQSKFYTDLFHLEIQYLK